MEDLSILATKLNLKFNNIKLLQQALVHRSYLNEHPEFPMGHNERLEFLGDAVLEIIVTEYLYNRFPDESEGVMTDWRASLVNAKTLADVATDLEFEDYLYLSKGEAKDKNTKARQYILANSTESVIGAIYLDQGLEVAKEFITKNIISRLDYILEHSLYQDPKSKFQEKSQEIYNITPHYEVLKEFGPDHNKIFEVGVYIKDKMICTGTGSSKHEAQVDAAAKGLKKNEW